MAKKTDNAKPKSRFFLYIMLGCTGILVLAVGLWLAVVLPEFMKESSQPVDTRTAEEIALEKEMKLKAMEETATWETFHCDLMHKYYSGPEEEIPLAEIIGLSSDVEEPAIKARCGELLPAVRLMGGWPSDRNPWDNFVVCEGFEFILKASRDLTIRPTAEDLRNNEVAYGVPDKWLRKQKLAEGYTRKTGEFAPLITQADDRCVIVGAGRIIRFRQCRGLTQAREHAIAATDARRRGTALSHD